MNVAKIYASYAFGEALVQAGKIQVDLFGVGQFPSHKPVFYILNEIGERTDPISKTKLLVKPLGGISEEDKTGLCEILDAPLQNAEFTVSSTGFKMKSFAWEREFLNTPPQHTHMDYIGVDFLRSRGYALPWGKWSVEELEKFGIYKIIGK